MELQRELERIKAERAIAQAKKDKEERELEEKRNTENALKGNPLVNMGAEESAKVRRRWNDDVVFRNQARDEPEHKKRFINDTIRNDFHRQFLKKFMK
jgi:protein CWC15